MSQRSQGIEVTTEPSAIVERSVGKIPHCVTYFTETRIHVRPERPKVSKLPEPPGRPSYKNEYAYHALAIMGPSNYTHDESALFAHDELA